MSHRNLFVAAASGLVIAVLVAVAPVRGAGWNPQLAAKYLDDRQRDWFAWPQAQSKDGPCVSCHTGMPYLLARPVLRRLLNEPQPTMYETGLLNRLRANAGAKPAGALQSVETIFAAMLLPQGDAAQAATFDQLWALQKKDGALQGGWLWYAANLEPWETPLQFRYGASLAALAIGSAPANLRNAEQVAALGNYLQDDVASRPLHVRLAMLWASTKLPSIMAATARQVTIDELLKKQQADGGWTLDSLGPWTEHPDAPVSPAAGASDSYATAFTAFVLKQGLGARDSGLATKGSGLGTRDSLRSSINRALNWLRAHQDPRTGAWAAVSMNKTYPAGSMQEKFLQDAATGFAAAALSNP
jgi:squalene-hopene/tetraprenyl-beta-curcumene cyclase